MSGANLHPCWLQIACHDLNRAVNFYKTCLNFNFIGMPDDPTADEAVAMFTFPGGPLEKALGGGIVKTPSHFSGEIQKLQSAGVRLMACIYFYSEDMEDTLAKIEANGGKITLSRHAIKGHTPMGYCAEFRDPEGNFHGIYTQSEAK